MKIIFSEAILSLQPLEGLKIFSRGNSQDLTLQQV